MKPDDVEDVQFGGQFLQRLGCSRPDPDGPPTTSTTSLDLRLGVSANIFAQRAAARGRLQRLNPPTNASTTASVGRPSARRASPLTSRREPFKIDSRWHCEHLARVRRRTARPARGLDVGVGDQPVRLATTCSSPIRRILGSGVSPSASAAF